MARIGIIFGLLLCGLTVVGLVEWTAKSPIQFLPMMLGIPILFCGVVALNPHRRKQAMQVAVTIATLGVVIAGCRALYTTIRWASGDPINRFAFKMVLATGVVCVVFVGWCVLSFVQGRRRNSADSLGSGGDPIASTKPAETERPELEASATGPD